MKFNMLQEPLFADVQYSKYVPGTLAPLHRHWYGTVRYPLAGLIDSTVATGSVVDDVSFIILRECAVRVPMLVL